MTATDTIALTDRDRLAFALDELAHLHGYQVSNLTDLDCCTRCMADRFRNAPRFVAWDSQHDEAAFRHGYPAVYAGATKRPVPECAVCAELSEEQEEALHPDDPALAVRHAARIDHILAEHTELRGQLDLLVGGDRHLVRDTLRRHGLHAVTSKHDGWVHVGPGHWAAA